MVGQRNHSQEEKDEELLRNITNYSSLLEQQLFSSNEDTRLKISNLSSEENAIMKNNFEEVKGFSQSKESKGKPS
jgi:hypothetical protein